MTDYDYTGTTLAQLSKKQQKKVAKAQKKAAKKAANQATKAALQQAKTSVGDLAANASFSATPATSSPYPGPPGGEAPAAGIPWTKYALIGGALLVGWYALRNRK